MLKKTVSKFRAQIYLFINLLKSENKMFPHMFFSIIEFAEMLRLNYFNLKMTTEQAQQVNI